MMAHSGTGAFPRFWTACGGELNTLVGEKLQKGRSAQPALGFRLVIPLFFTLVALFDVMESLDADSTKGEFLKKLGSSVTIVEKNGTKYIQLNTTCYSGTTGITLQDSPDCLQGFFCPNTTAKNPPEYCPPTAECQISRIAGAPCPAQGLYEPMVCARGYYCPPPGKEKIICPSGYFCPLGSFEPTKCNVGSYCPEGSVRRKDWVGLPILLIIDFILLASTFGVALTKAFRIRFGSGRYAALRMQAREYRNSRRVARASRIRSDSLQSEIEKGKMGLHNRNSSLSTFNDSETSTLAGVMEDPVLPVSDHSLSRAHSDLAKGVLKKWKSRRPGIHEEEEPIGQDVMGLVKGFKKSIEGESLGLTFTYRDLGLTLKGNKLLAGVSGSIERGSIWGVMGPSGAGKTTFMSVLMGKISKTAGSLLVNGVRKDMKDYRRIIGYVPQEDILHPELTVRENILHSARIRLPCTWSAHAIEEHVDRVVTCLALSHVQHSLVGDAAKRGISGGQRKRVNIGLELASAPMALFLDEPTSGLDSTAALHVMKLLQAVSRLGVTVVSVIHQPRTEIFDCLDNIMLIAAGQAVYQGPRERMIEYFKEDGFWWKPSVNPADVIMDIISGQGYRHRILPRENEVAQLIQRWTKRTEDVNRRSTPTPINSPADATALQRSVKKRGAYWYKQTWYCFTRSLVQQYRQANTLFLELFVGTLAGALMGFAVQGAQGKLFSGIYKPPFSVLSVALQYMLIPMLGLISGIAIALAGSPSGVKVFGEEKLQYWREAGSGHSRSAYYIGKVLSTIFRIIISSLHFAVFFTLLATPYTSFGELYSCILLYFYCIYGLASCVSMLTRKDNGPLLAVIVGLVVSVLCGYGPSLADAKRWGLGWFWRAQPGTWYTEAFMSKELEGWAHLYEIEHAARKQGFALDRFGGDMAALVIIGTVYRILAYLGLVLLKRDRQR